MKIFNNLGIDDSCFEVKLVVLENIGGVIYFENGS